MDAITKQQHYLLSIEHDMWVMYNAITRQMNDYGSKGNPVAKRDLGTRVGNNARALARMSDHFVSAFDELERMVNEQANT